MYNYRFKRTLIKDCLGLSLYKKKNYNLNITKSYNKKIII